jgi:uncharacterized membrane protein (UPF0127 family)
MLYNVSRNSCLAARPRRAESFFERLLGLMGRKNFPADRDALVFEDCNAIHCCFMRMAIDVIFVDSSGHVVKCCHSLKPWRLAFGGAKACTVIELPAGTLLENKTEPGDRLSFG